MTMSGVLALTILWVTLMVPQPAVPMSITHSKLAHMQKTLQAQAQATAGGPDLSDVLFRAVGGATATARKVNHGLKGRVPSFIKSPGREIYDAVMDRSPSGLERLLEKHPYAVDDYIDSDGNTALILAVIASTRSPTKFDRDKAYQCALTLVQMARTTTENKRGDTALHIAVRDNLPIEFVYILVKYGANTTATNRHTETPLYVAAVQRNILATAYFVVVDKQTVAPRVRAAQDTCTPSWLSLVKRAVDNVNDGRVTVSPKAKKLLSDYLQILSPSDTEKERASRGEPKSTRRKFTRSTPQQTPEETPASVAMKILNAVAADTSSELAKLLEVHGSLPGALDGKDAMGYTPLALAITKIGNGNLAGAKRCFNLLLKYANCNKKDNDGNTALMLAVKVGLKLWAIRAIVESGGDYEASNADSGKTVLSVAADNDDMFVYSYLRLKGAPKDRWTRSSISRWREKSEYEHLTKFLGMQLYQGELTSDEKAVLKEYMAILREEGAAGTETDTGTGTGTSSGSGYSGAGAGSKSSYSYSGAGAGGKSSYNTGTGTSSGSSYSGTGAGGKSSYSSYNNARSDAGSQSRSPPPRSSKSSTPSTTSSIVCSEEREIERDFRAAIREGAAAVKRYYRKKALKFHPDKTASMSDADKAVAEECFKKLGQLYDRYNDQS